MQNNIKTLKFSCYHYMGKKFESIEKEEEYGQERYERDKENM